MRITFLKHNLSIHRKGAVFFQKILHFCNLFKISPSGLPPVPPRKTPLQFSGTPDVTGGATGDHQVPQPLPALRSCGDSALESGNRLLRRPALHGGDAERVPGGTVERIQFRRPAEIRFRGLPLAG